MRLTFARVDAGRQFDVLVNGVVLQSVAIEGDALGAFYTQEVAIPAALVGSAGGTLVFKFARACRLDCRRPVRLAPVALSGALRPSSAAQCRAASSFRSKIVFLHAKLLLGSYI